MDETKSKAQAAPDAAPVAKAGRGASYPALSLPDAITRAQQFWNAERKSAAPIAAAAEHWGYSTKSSGARLAVAALLHYGLMEDSGSSETRTVKLSARALDILLSPPESPAWKAAVQEAARSPKIIADILTKWGVADLPSDQTLRYYLLRERDFNETAADGFIKDFRKTIVFAKLVGGANIDVGISTKADPVLDKKPPKPEIAVGDYVQWESAGVLQFEAARRVRAFADHDGEQWAFVDDSETGIPMTELLLERKGEKLPAAAAPQVAPTLAMPSKPAVGKQVGASIPVSATCSMSIIADGEVTQDGLDKLKSYIDLIKSSFPKTVETKPA